MDDSLLNLIEKMHKYRNLCNGYLPTSAYSAFKFVEAVTFKR